MRILFTTHPAYGHFRPLLPLTAALRARGHDVRVGTSGRFGPVVEAHGLPAVPVGLDWLESDKSTIPDELRAPAGSTLEAFFAHQFVWMTAERLARDVIAHARDWAPDIIVRESTEFGGALAAEAIGIPVAAVQVASPSLITPEMLATIEPVLNDARAGLGLPPDPGLARLQSAPVLCFAPPALHDPEVPLPPFFSSYRPEPFDGPSSPNPELRSGRPFVYATLGTVFNDPELPFFPAVVDGLGGEDLDVLVALGPGVDPGSLGPQPANVRVATYVEQRAVLSTCSVVVCHGGYGTLLDAVDAAVPLVVVPFGADQHINGASVERLGIGRVIDEEALNASVLREAVLTMLADRRWRSRIGELRDAWHALPPAGAAAAFIEQGVHRPGSFGADGASTPAPG